MDPNQNNPTSPDPAAPVASDNNQPPVSGVDPGLATPQGAGDSGASNPFAIPAASEPTPGSPAVPSFSPPPPDLGGPVSFDPQAGATTPADPVQPAVSSADQGGLSAPSVPNWSATGSGDTGASPLGSSDTNPFASPSGDTNASSATGSSVDFGSMTPPSGGEQSSLNPSVTPQSENNFSTPPLDASTISSSPQEPPSFMASSGESSVPGVSSQPLEAGNQGMGNTGLEDSVPTDLSHLVTDANAQVTTPQTPPPSAETLVVPQSADGSQVVTGGGGLSFPKWLIAVGVVVLLAVIGGSAYFILGVGKTPEPTNNISVPVSTPSNENSASQPFLPPEVPSSPTTPSGSLGDLSGSATPTPESTSSGRTTSAIELLRQRQNK